MALNPNFVPLTPLWEVFTDKDLLTFLSDGFVRFFIDTERTVGKPVYQLTGSPPNYAYTPYGFLDTDGSWRVNMNLQGAFDQVIYGFPLDEFGNVQLYFAQFYNSDGVFQFSREGFPNFFAPGGSTSTPVDINFIPDGQFRLHTDIPSTATLSLGEVRDPITQIAFGGWTFERPIASTARDFVTFQRIGSFVTNPIKSPRYAVEIVCEAPNAGDTFKDLRVKFDDVNKFSSDTDMFTFGITGKVVSSGSIVVELIIIKNFGTGGDPTTETVLTTFTLTSVFTPFSFAFSFGANTGAIIGPNNDDYVQLALRFPSNELFDVEFTDALLTPGTIVNPTFNDTTTREFLYESLFDDTDCPAFDGSDIGLPLVLTKTGLRFDHSEIGFIFASGSLAIPFGFLEADGVKYDTLLHSLDGIPYSRLGAIYTFNLTTEPLPFSIHTFGSGTDFVTMYVDALLNLILSTNQQGATTPPSDGGNPTGFTFGTIHIGNTNVDAKGYLTTGGTLYIIANSVGFTTFTSNITIGGTITSIIDAPRARAIQAVNITSVAAGQYFVFYTSTQPYAVWYKVNGAGTQPVIPGVSVYIEVDITSGVSVHDIAKFTSDAISGKQISFITTVPASAIPQSAYFNFLTTTQAYYAWYNKDGGGTDPMLLGKIGIQVNILSTDTKDQVTSKTASSINLRYFATPDLRGIFLKGYSGLSGNDLAAQSRYSSNSVMYGNTIGSREFSNNISHSHDLFQAGGAGNAVTFNSPAYITTGEEIPPVVSGVRYEETTSQGTTESHPENIYVHYIVKY